MFAMRNHLACGLCLGSVSASSPTLASATFVFVTVVVLLLLIGALIALGIRFIPNDRIGIVEKLWSFKGSVTEGRIMAFNGEAGYEAKLLRGGVHLFKWFWQYRVHKLPLVAIPQGKIGYVYARDGEPLCATQTLGRVVNCNNFQDAEAFLGRTHDDVTVPASPGLPLQRQAEHAVGQRGRQRAILREGVYAINLALFTVITEDNVFHMNLQGKAELEKLLAWQRELKALDGFNPVVIGEEMSAIDPLNPEKSLVVDSIGIVTVHDGPSLSPGEIIAPAVGSDSTDPHYHNNFQDTEAFLAAGGRRGRQYVPLTDGTYFINRWFATVETTPKTVVALGPRGVVVS
jgi:hypothetical protein